MDRPAVAHGGLDLRLKSPARERGRLTSPGDVALVSIVTLVSYEVFAGFTASTVRHMVIEDANHRPTT